MSAGRGCVPSAGVTVAEGASWGSPSMAVRSFSGLLCGVIGAPRWDRRGTEAQDRTGRTGTAALARDRKSTRLNSSHVSISYAVFCLKKKKKEEKPESATIIRGKKGTILNIRLSTSCDEDGKIDRRAIEHAYSAREQARTRIVMIRRP